MVPKHYQQEWHGVQRLRKREQSKQEQCVATPYQAAGTLTSLRQNLYSVISFPPPSLTQMKKKKKAVYSHTTAL